MSVLTILERSTKLQILYKVLWDYEVNTMYELIGYIILLAEYINYELSQQNEIDGKFYGGVNIIHDKDEVCYAIVRLRNDLVHVLSIQNVSNLLKYVYKHFNDIKDGGIRTLVQRVRPELWLELSLFYKAHS